MLRLVRFFVWLFARCVLALRYRVRLHGIDRVRSLAGPVLVVPNHPAFIEPVILITWLAPTLRPRPFLFEGNFKGALYPMMFLLDAIRVPDLDTTSAEARQRTEEAIKGLIDSLHAGENAVLWPSGRLQRAAVERLGAARTLSDVLQAVPEATVVVVRTRGLWGSRFSYGFTGKRPRFVRRLLQGAGLLLANLIFFAPRRTVDITLEALDRARLPGIEREVLNPWLEAWFNGDGPEKPTFVPAHFLFGPRQYAFPDPPPSVEVDLSKLIPETREAVNEMVAEKIGRPIEPAEGSPESTLEQLGMDSLDRMDLSLQVERRFGFTGDQVPATLGQLYALASGLAHRDPPRPPTPEWFRPPTGDLSVNILGNTIGEAFVNRALACRRDVVCADDRSGVLTYERLLVGAILMARRFQSISEPHVGVLLPASVGCDIALLGLYLANKVPVVLNWTTGPDALNHAARLMGLRVVVSSRAFVDRVGIQVAGTEFLHLEILRKQVGRIEALRTLLTVRWLPGQVRKLVPAVDPEAPAVVLFTSGSEKAPKAVPLTHSNLLTNQRDGIRTLQVTRRDAVLGFLPAFHSFGMSVTGLVPILSGMRVVRHPDPTDAGALARKTGTYKPTILVGTPTFASYILERSEPGELASLRMVIVGAEKCPPSVFARFQVAAPGCAVLEGYGITECSPVVAVNPPDANRPGTVGKVMPSLQTLVMDLDTETPLPPGQPGMLWVSGTTVFPGYLGYEGESPFRQRDGVRWYVTGDIVCVDAENYIHFAGRLKRFLKIGGEMVSLPRLEEPFARLLPPTEKDGARVAVEGVELESGGRIVLFTTEDLTLRQANDILQKEGMHGVYRIHEVRRLEKLPGLGAKQVDYKVLRAQVLQRAGEREA